MTFDYIPSTEEVRDIYRGTLIHKEGNTYEVIDPEQADAELDAWLEQMGRDIGASAWEEGVRAILHALRIVKLTDMPVNPYLETDGLRDLPGLRELVARKSVFVEEETK